jgi:hypothetical protein
MAATRRVFPARERPRVLLARIGLEQVCWRATLLAGAVEGDASASVSLRLDGGVADDLSEGERRDVEGEVAVADGSDGCRVGGAALRYDCDRGCSAGGCCRRDLHRAMMCAVLSAADGQTCVGAIREGQEGRDQRKAEEQKQNGAEKTPHSAIVASFFRLCVRRMSVIRGFFAPDAGRDDRHQEAMAYLAFG